MDVPEKCAIRLSRSHTRSQTRLLLAAICLLFPSSAWTSTVFLEQRDAELVLKTRRPRANFFLEEMLPGSLERECYEEACSLEEATEIFQSREKTMEFWYRYKNLNPCQKNPCLNGGICSTDRNDFLCLCPPRFDGKRCEIEVFECQYKNGGCLQYCTSRGRTTHVACSCADGYRLQEDGRTCEDAVPFPCGKRWLHGSLRRSLLDEVLLLNETGSDGENSTDSPPLGGANDDQRIVGGQLERQGGSPWQVLVHRQDGYGFCGGALVNPRWVVSAAHCFQETPDHVTIGNYDKMRPDPEEQTIQVERLVIHPHFHEFTFDSDVALLHLSQPVKLGRFAAPLCLPNAHLAQLLLREGQMGAVTGWGATQYLGRSSRFLRRVELPVVEQSKCALSTEQVITDNMFCAGYLDEALDACGGDSGGPFATNYRGTWYLTGVVSWGEKCASVGKYGVYTRLGNYLSWVRETVQSHNTTLT